MRDSGKASACLDQQTLLDYLGGSTAREAIDVHLAGCAACRSLVRHASAGAATEAALPAAHAPTVTAVTDATGLGGLRPLASLAAGDQVGRFLIEARLGAGGMGVVYAAYDPKLDRRVALKLLHGPASEDASKQLMQEGRAIARLSHPNVVTVYDVGEDGGQWYVAMELVQGGTLSDWLRAAPRSPTAILNMFAAAGRGLAAAHEAGLVHRDFKPANVLVGDDDRPRVTDFGIALHEVTPADDDAIDTSDGAIVGTPAYMAPEQIDGRPVDARADQFSFAVALYEALDGRRPFPGKTLTATRELMAKAPPTPRALVPIRAVVALLRALKESPGDRFPSMTHLLRRVAPWRVRAVHLVALASALAVGGISTKLLHDEAAAPTCTGLDAGLAGVWDHARADAMSSAFLQTNVAGASDVARSARAGLERYATSWIAQRTDTCEAAQIRREQTPAQQELRTVCLDERLAELRAVTDVLIAPDREVITNALGLVASLTPPQACADLATLTERLPVPTSPEQLAQVRSLRVQLMQARAQVAAGQFRLATDHLTSLQLDIDHTNYRPLQAEAALAAGILADKQGYLAEADKRLRDAVLAAEAGRDSRTAASAWLRLVHVRARGRGDISAANDALAHATANVERLGADLDASADLAYARGVALREAGNYGESRSALEEAIRLLQRSRLDRTVERARAQLDLAGVLGALGEERAARSTADSAIAQLRTAVGDSHPDLAGGLVVAAATALRQRDIAAGSAALDEAERILRATVGVEHPRYAQLLVVRASQLSAENRPKESAELLLRAIAIYQKRFGDEHSQVAMLHRMIAVTALNSEDLSLARRELAIATDLFERGMGHDSFEAVQTRMLSPWLARLAKDLDRAEDAARASVEECSKLLGMAHPVTAEASRTLGYVLDLRDKHAEAAVAYTEALEILRRAGAAEFRTTALYQTELADTLLRMNRYDDAIATLTAALAIELKSNAEHSSNARTARYLLADAYRGAKQPARSAETLETLVTEMSAQSGNEADPLLHNARMWLGIDLAERDPTRARELVTGARAALVKLDPDAVSTADAWLRSHR